MGEYEVIRSQTQPEIKAGNAKRIVLLTRLVRITRNDRHTFTKAQPFKMHVIQPGN